jgi:hypothetical protein
LISIDELSGSGCANPSIIVSPESKGPSCLYCAIAQGEEMSEQHHSLPSKSSVEPNFAAYIGIDWSDRKHDICLYDVDTQSRTCLKLEHRAEVIHEWVASLRQ